MAFIRVPAGAGNQRRIHGVPVSTRMDPTDFAALTKYPGTEGNKSLIVDGMDRYEALRKVSLKSRVGT